MRTLGKKDGSFPLQLSAPSLWALKNPRSPQAGGPLIGRELGRPGGSNMDYQDYQDYQGNSTDDYSNYDNITMDPNVSVDNTSHTHQLKAVDVITLVVYAATFLVGVPGNSLVVWVTGFEVKRNINAIWFLNLAVADLLSCLSLPILFVTILHHNAWYFGDASCRVFPSLLLLNMYASILLLATISADRFLLVFYPVWCQNYRRTLVAWAACAGAWLLALLLSAPTFAFRRVHVEYFPPKKMCVVDYGRGGSQKEKAVATVRLVVGFLLPLVTLGLCYSFLLVRAWSRSATRSTKTLKVVAVVVTSFFVLWLPYQVTGMILAFLPRRHATFQAALRIDPLCVSVAYVNSCVNPVIYVAAVQGFHARLLRSLPGRLRSVLTEESSARESRSFTLSTVDGPAQKSQAL